MRTFLIACCALLIAAKAVAGENAASPRPAYHQVVAQFEAVAFGSEFGPAHDQVWRWRSAVGFAVTADDRGDAVTLRQQLEPHMTAITRLTGIAFDYRADREQADMEAVLADRAAFAGWSRRWPLAHTRYAAATAISACMAFLSIRNDDIVWAGLLYDADIPDRLRRDCLLEELVQAMGLPNDACHYRPSLFCEDDLVDVLDGADAVLLQTLYDPRLRPGMSRQAAMPIARTIIRELWPGPRTAPPASN